MLRPTLPTLEPDIIVPRVSSIRLTTLVDTYKVAGSGLEASEAKCGIHSFSLEELGNQIIKLWYFINVPINTYL